MAEQHEGQTEHTRIDRREVKFIRQDGTFSEGSVANAGITETGELMFFEIIDLIAPRLNGVDKYKRIVIRRIFPVVEIDEEGGE